MTERTGRNTAMRAPFHIEMMRSPRGMSLIISGIISVSELSDVCITLKSHGGRITVIGQRLLINVFESRAVEINGRVEGVSFSYGKIK